jgi:hypothetical protein
VPGAANLRLPRFTGDRIARQAIQYERKLICDSFEGRLMRCQAGGCARCDLHGQQPDVRLPQRNC